jgi:MoaA/NifB/PqqE/SkfB family radical SAM enzyme
MNVILTNYGHKTITELLKQHLVSRLQHNSETLRHDDEVQCFLLNLLTSRRLPYHAHSLYHHLIARGMIERVPDSVTEEEIALRYKRNPLENIQRIIFEYTTYCGFNCHHCYNTRVPRVTEQDVGVLKNAIDVFVQMGVRRFDFIGGEVARYGDSWLDLVRHIRTHGNIIVTLFTSGWWLGQQNFMAAAQRYPNESVYLAALKESGLTHIIFSLDGQGAVHDENRGQPGLYQRILAGFEQVRTAGLEPRVALLIRHAEPETPEFVSFLVDLAERLYRFPAVTPTDEKVFTLIKDPLNTLSRFIDIGNGTQDRGERFNLHDTPDSILYCKGFFRPAPFLTIKANGEIATCRITNAGEGYGNIHQQDLVHLLNHLQDNFVFKLHAERRLGEYIRFVDPTIFGNSFAHLCTLRAILTLIAGRMAESGVESGDRKTILRLNHEVAKFTGHA